MQLSEVQYLITFYSSLDTHTDNASALSLIRPRTIQTVKKAAISALERGPLVGGEVTNTQVILHNLVISKRVAESFLMSATAQCVQKVSNVKSDFNLQRIYYEKYFRYL